MTERLATTMFSDQELHPILNKIEHIRSDSLLSTLLNANEYVAIAIWDCDGTALIANKYITDCFFQSDPSDVMGHNIREFIPSGWARERLDIVNRCIDTNEPIVMLSILQGQRVRLCFHPLVTDHNDRVKPCALMTVEHISAERYNRIVKEDKGTVLHSDFVNLGPLDVLTARQLEVLALMGQGKRTKEIAKMLCRSPSTIENHRDMIGSKLNVTDRSKLIEIANLAALQVEDAGRKRVRFRYEHPRQNG